MGFGIAVISVGVLFLLAIFIRRSFGISVCALCVSVAGTWALMLGARALGLSVDPIVLSLLMGGSAVGIVYQYGRSTAGPFVRACAAISGFFAAYSAVEEKWLSFIIGAFVFLIFIGFSRRGNVISSAGASAKEIEEKLKNCC